MQDLVHRYVIMDKEKFQFYDGEGLTSELSDAAVFDDFAIVKYELESMDEPKLYDILEIDIIYEIVRRVKLN